MDLSQLSYRGCKCVLCSSLRSFGPSGSQSGSPARAELKLSSCDLLGLVRLAHNPRNILPDELSTLMFAASLVIRSLLISGRCSVRLESFSDSPGEDDGRTLTIPVTSKPDSMTHDWVFDEGSH